MALYYPAIHLSKGENDCIWPPVPHDRRRLKSKSRRDGGQGGAICSLGQLQIEETTFASNSVAGSHGRGGGIFHTNGAMTVLLSTFAENCAFGDQTTGYYWAAGGAAQGGAICNRDSGLVTDSLFVSNSAAGGQGFFYFGAGGPGTNGGLGEAGAVFNSGALELVRCALAANRTNGGKGSYAASSDPGQPTRTGRRRVGRCAPQRQRTTADCKLDDSCEQSSGRCRRRLVVYH